MRFLVYIFIVAVLVLPASSWASIFVPVFIDASSEKNWVHFPMIAPCMQMH